MDECLIRNGGCEHECTNLIGSFVCSCNDGYELDTNSFNCTSKRSDNYELVFGNVINACHYHADINECLDSSLNNCHVNGTCFDTMGSYNCSCNVGFSGNGTECYSKNTVNLTG